MKQGQVWLGAAILATVACLGSAALAQTTDPGETLDAKQIPGLSADATISRHQDGRRDPNRGSVTNLPLPRYVSLKGGEGNARRGPSLSHRIDWVFTMPGMPLRVTAEHEHWRRVEDSEGAGGWVHYALLSGSRSVLVTRDLADLHAAPDLNSAIVARAEAGVVARLLQCRDAWCRISRDRTRGWVEKSAIWGVESDEAID